MTRIAAAKALPLLALLAGSVLAAPDRDSLTEAWEDYLRSLPATATLEAIGEGRYRYHDLDLPYEGELAIGGVLVRPTDPTGFETEFTHVGMLDLELGDLPAERLTSQLYYYWLADRQSLYYSKVTQSWFDTAAYNARLAEAYGDDGLAPMSFMLNYGIWILLVALLLFVFRVAARQSKKARSLMDENSEIIRRARENIDRAAEQQDEQLAIAREIRELQAQNNDLLKMMLAALSG